MAGIQSFFLSGWGGAPPIEKTGVGQQGLSASGVSTRERHKAGGGQEGLSATGADVVQFTETGQGLLGFFGSGTKTVSTLIIGTIYSKTGGGESSLSVAGADATTFVEAGAGSFALSGSGVKQLSFIFEKTGSGISALSGSGTQELPTAVVYETAGSGELRMAASGAAVSEAEAEPVEPASGHSGDWELYQPLRRLRKTGVATLRMRCSGTSEVSMDFQMLLRDDDELLLAGAV